MGSVHAHGAIGKAEDDGDWLLSCCWLALGGWTWRGPPGCGCGMRQRIASASTCCLMPGTSSTPSATTAPPQSSTAGRHWSSQSPWTGCCGRRSPNRKVGWTKPWNI